MARRRRISGKKLLVASAGVASLIYVGCGGSEISGNLVASPCDTDPNGCNTGGSGQGGQGGQGGSGGTTGAQGGQGGAGGHQGGAGQTGGAGGGG